MSERAKASTSSERQKLKLELSQVKDTSAALRLDTVSVRWQLPKGGGLVEAQHGRLSGQLRVLLEGKLIGEAPALASPVTVEQQQRSLNFESAGRAYELEVRRGGKAGGYDYHLTVDGEKLEATPHVQPPSLSTPRQRLETARKREEAATERAAFLENQMTARSSTAGTPFSTARSRKDEDEWDPMATGASGPGDSTGAGGSLDEARVPSRWLHVHDARPQVVFVAPEVPPAMRTDRDRVAMARQRAVAAAMRQAGLHLRRHLSEDGKHRYLCVSAREARLLLEASRLGMEMRLGVEWRSPPLRKRRGEWQFSPDYDAESEGDARHVAAYSDFKLDQIERFEPFVDNEFFFRPLERQRLIYSVMQAAPSQGGAGIDLSSLLAGGRWQWDDTQADDRAAPKEHARTFTTMFSTHTNRTRFVLAHRWFGGGPRLLAAPPLDDIRDYYGEKVGFYFAFLHHYTRWLAYIALPSLATLIIQLMPPSVSCGGNDFAVGSLCQMWTGLDNVFVPVFAVFISTWSALFLEYWKRYQSVLGFKWDCTDFEEEEPVRPEFHRNPATKQRLGYYTQSAGFMPLGATISPYFPRERQMSRLLRAGLVTLCFMVTVISGTMALLAFRVFMQKDALFQREFRRLSIDLGWTPPSNATLSNASSGELGAEDAPKLMGADITALSGVIAGCLNGVFIVVFNAIYRAVAVLLTDWENHRTDSQYENSLILKSFCFQFVNSYTSFFYIAFFRAQRLSFFGLSVVDEHGEAIVLSDTCSTSRWWGHERPNDCMTDLFMQMVIVVLLKGWLRHGLALGLPKLRRCVQLCCGRAPEVVDHDELEGLPKLEYERSLGPHRGTFYEYNEMAIQFGYLTMFAAAAPWAAAFCMANNEIERRVDAYKMLYTQQRPRYHGAESIGTWYQVFNVLTVAAVVTNCLIIGYTSTTLSKFYQLSGSQVLWVVLLLEHALLLLKLGVENKVADVPLWVRKTAEYQKFLQDGERVKREGELEQARRRRRLRSRPLWPRHPRLCPGLISTGSAPGAASHASRAARHSPLRAHVHSPSFTATAPVCQLRDELDAESDDEHFLI